MRFLGQSWATSDTALSFVKPLNLTQELESYARKKEIVQALIREGKAEYLLRLDDLKEARENREEEATAEDSPSLETRVKSGSVSFASIANRASLSPDRAK